VLSLKKMKKNLVIALTFWNGTAQQYPTYYRNWVRTCLRFIVAPDPEAKILV
jgi:hypothetical protein